jgi:hypothetical protein
VQEFRHLLTSLVFAAHALLGCGVHQLCQHATEPVERAAHHCSHHDGPAGHPSESQAPADGHRCPLQTCQHIACSFVKSDTVRIDHGERNLAPVTLPIHTTPAAASPFDHAWCDSSKANLSSARLYVWHCALLI